MNSFCRFATAFLLIQTLTMMIKYLNDNYNNVEFEDMNKVSVWTGELITSSSKQIFFYLDKKNEEAIYNQLNQVFFNVNGPEKQKILTKFHSIFHNLGENDKDMQDIKVKTEKVF